MASEDAERRGRRRWFRILGSSDAERSRAARCRRSRHGRDAASEPPEPTSVRGRCRMPRPSRRPVPTAADRAGGAGRGGDRSRIADPEPSRGDRRRADAARADGAPEPDRADARRRPHELGPMDRRSRSPCRVILAIANQKGGVGKTTTAVNLGAALAELGFRVLVVDLDPQGNATTGLGISHRNVEGSIYDVIMNDTPVEDCVEPTTRPEPVRRPRHDRPRRRRDRARARLLARAEAAAGAPGRPRRLRLHR